MNSTTNTPPGSSKTVTQQVRHPQHHCHRAVTSLRAEQSAKEEPSAGRKGGHRGSGGQRTQVAGDSEGVPVARAQACLVEAQQGRCLGRQAELMILKLVFAFYAACIRIGYLVKLRTTNHVVARGSARFRGGISL